MSPYILTHLGNLDVKKILPKEKYGGIMTIEGD